MLILAAVVLVAHIVGTTNAANQRRLNGQMPLALPLRRLAPIIVLVAGEIGMVTDIWGSAAPPVQLHAPILAFCD